MMIKFCMKRWLPALMTGIVLGLAPSLSHAGIFVFGENGTAKADNTVTNKTFDSIIVGAPNPSTTIYSVKLKSTPAQPGVTVTGSLTPSGDAKVDVSTVSLTDGGTKNIVVGLNATTVGIHSGNIVLHRTSAATTTADRDDTLHLQVKVLNHSDASFAENTEQTTLTLDFGNVEHGWASDLKFFEIWNRVTTANFTAGLVLTGITATGETDLFDTNLSVFSDPLFAAEFLQFNAQFLSPSKLGLHTAQYILHFSDENLAGATAKDLILNLRGTAIAPEPSSLLLGMCGFLSLTGAGWWRRRRASA